MQAGKYGLTGLAIHLAGFALGFIGEGFILMGVIGLESGSAVLAPVGDLLYGLGLVIVVAVAARVGVPMKYLVVAGIVIGVGIFFKSAPHEIHVASGLGFGLEHPPHIGIGAIMITVSVAVLAVSALVYNRSNRQGDRK
jgi:hypothetical protein